MNIEHIFNVDVGNIEFTCGLKRYKGIELYCIDNDRGGFILSKHYSVSRWMRFAQWVNKKILKNQETFTPTQWITINWEIKGKNVQRSYNFVPIDKGISKSAIAPQAASIGMLYSFIKEEAPIKELPEFIEVHFESVFGHRVYKYGKVREYGAQNDIISSFVLCKTMVEKNCLAQSNSCLH